MHVKGRLKRSIWICSQGRARAKIITTQIKSSAGRSCRPAATTTTESWPSGASSAASPASESSLWWIQSRYFLLFFCLLLSTAAKSLGQGQTELQALTQKWTPNSRMMFISTGCAGVQLFNQSYCADQPDGWSEGHRPQHRKGKLIHFAFVFRNPKQEVKSTIFSFPLNRHKRWQIQSSPSIFHDGQGSLASSPSWRGLPFWSQFLR